MGFLKKLMPRGGLFSGEMREQTNASPWGFKDDPTLHRRLQGAMKLYNFLTHEQQGVIRDFVSHFYIGKEVIAGPSFPDVEEALLAIAANAALVGAAQKTDYFSTVKWLYLYTDNPDLAGSATGHTTVCVDASLCVLESRFPMPGNNLVVHEFAHVLDAQLGISSSTEALKDGYRQYLHDIENGTPVPIADCFTDLDVVDFVFDEQPPTFHPDFEFFAAASEAFFTNACDLREYHKPLYKELSLIYGLDLADLDWEHIWDR